MKTTIAINDETNFYLDGVSKSVNSFERHWPAENSLSFHSPEMIVCCVSESLTLMAHIFEAD